jgi:adenine-specific DNA-methyltransferase
VIAIVYKNTTAYCYNCETETLWATGRGLMTREGLFRKNSKDSGHYHSNWLSMMYPRLFLARNLLRDNGLIFVSIDDNEVHNLRLLMNEVFGEENFLGCISRVTGTPTGGGFRILVNEIDYLLMYSKTTIPNIEGLPMTDEDAKIYDQEDSHGKYLIRPLRRTGGEDRREDRPSMFYELIAPDGQKILPYGPTGYESRWICGIDKYNDLLKNNLIEWRKIKKNNSESWQVYQKYYLEGRLKQPSNLWDNLEGNKKATRDMRSLFNDKKIFDYPKPVELIQRIIKLISFDSSDIILDFFAGSCTTAHSVLALNKEDDGNRKFICVQLPEKCDENSEAFKAGYKTIAEIGKERIRRVIKKIQEEQNGKLDLDGNATKQDLGFKVFKLQESNFKIWRSNIETEEELVAQMQRHLEPLDEHAKTEDVLYELLIKSGVQLTAKIKEKNGYILVNDNEIALMLEKVDNKIIQQIIVAKPQKVFALDRLFKNNDKLKTNTALQMKDAGIEFKAI